MTEFSIYRDDPKVHAVTYERPDGEPDWRPGRIRLGTTPLTTTADLDAAIMFAEAWLGREPSETLYVADERRRVLRRINNEKHHEAVRHARAARTLILGLFLLCFVALCSAACGVPGRIALFDFVVDSVLYILLSAFLLNEIEAAILCLILLLPSVVVQHTWH
jgi:hypothetical protein